MPNVFTKDGYRFFFYSNDHKPIHVHVRYGEGEAVIEVDSDVELRDNYGLNKSEIKHAMQLASEHQKLIIRKWHEHFD